MGAKTKLLKAFALIALVWVFSTSPTVASVATFSDSWHGVSVSYYGFGYYTIDAYGSGSACVSVPLTNVDISQFDESTPFALDIGNVGEAGPVCSGVLGDDKNFTRGKTVAHFKGGVTVSWTSTNVTATVDAETDFLNEESVNFDNSDGNPVDNTHSFGGTYEMDLTLGAFSYSNPNVYVGGHNSETIYSDLPGQYPEPLEDGWIHGVADFVPPTLSILSPATELVKVYPAQNLIRLNGLVADNIDVASLNIYLNGDVTNSIRLNSPEKFPAKNLSWTATFDLGTNADAHFGSNSLSFVARDASGNETSVSRAILWIKTNSAMVTVNPGGAGSVRGLHSGQILQEGFSYHAEAVPANTNWIFSGWTDNQTNLLSCNSSFDYIDTDDRLIAHFATNPFAHGLSGHYAGLFGDPNNIAATNAGFFALNVSPGGGYSGYLLIAGKRLPLSGQFTLLPDLGAATNRCLIPLGDAQILALSLQVSVDTNLTNLGAGVLSGSVSAQTLPNGSTPLWSSQISGALSVPMTNAVSSAAIRPGIYNLVFVHPPDSSPWPAGYSYGAATVHSDGAVSWVMHLADGATPPISFSSYLLLDGSCPFYASLYGGKGVIYGSVSFTPNSAHWAISSFAWMKPPGKDSFYPIGFSGFTDTFLSRYEAPASGINTLGWKQSVFDFGWPDIVVSIPVAFDPDKIKFSSINAPSGELTMSFAPLSGFVSGAFRPLQTSKSLPFRALVVGSCAYGFTATNYQTAPITIGPAALPPITPH